MGGKYVRPYSEYKDINMDYQIIYRVATKGLRPTMPVCDCRPIFMKK
jgi:hypothetical protein